jgi:hypothetical protein
MAGGDRPRHIPTRHDEKPDGREAVPRAVRPRTASRNDGYLEEPAGQTPTRRETAHRVGKEATPWAVGYPDSRRRNPAGGVTGGREDGPRLRPGQGIECVAYPDSRGARRAVGTVSTR